MILKKEEKLQYIVFDVYMQVIHLQTSLVYDSECSSVTETAVIMRIRGLLWIGLIHNKKTLFTCYQTKVRILFADANKCATHYEKTVVYTTNTKLQ